jgi:Ca2+-binding EF-hand superfamily protein
MATIHMNPGTVPDEFLETFRENFELLDAGKQGFLSKQEAALLFRGLGQTPTQHEMEDILASLPERVSFDDFVQWFGESYKAPLTTDELVEAFRVFDLADTGVLSIDKFKELVMGLADSLSPEDVENIMKEVPVDSRGNFDYVVFARRLAEGPKGCPSLRVKE